MTTKYAPRGPIKARTDPMDVPDPMPGQCTAKSKQAQRRCKKPAIPGGTVCRMHGGAAPQVKRAALERLKGYQDAALDRLLELAQQKEFPSTAYQAVRDILDRTLGKPAESVAVEHTGEIRFLHELPEK